MNEWEGDKGILFNDMLFDQFGITIDDRQATAVGNWLMKNTPNSDKCRLSGLIRNFDSMVA
jgi:hypothetical protein